MKTRSSSEYSDSHRHVITPGVCTQLGVGGVDRTYDLRGPDRDDEPFFRRGGSVEHFSALQAFQKNNLPPPSQPSTSKTPKKRAKKKL